MLILDSIPKISDDFNKSLKDLRNYIIDLNAWLRHQLYHLEIENFTDETKDKIVGIKNVNTDSATKQSVLIEINKAVQNATELITGHQGGYVVLNPAEKPSEILVMDTDDITTATKVWRWNGAGLGYSSTGYDGTYGLAMTMDGAINADFITAGKITSLELVSATITGGTININDKFKVDTLGNVTMTGAISWGSENSPVKVQYSIDGSTMWHDTFTAGDTFAKYSYDGGTTYTSAVKIIGTDGAIGPTGTSVTDVTEYYLATSASSGVTTETLGWTTSIQTITSTNKYLWNYEKITFSDSSSQNTLPVIMGVYGDTGDTGDTGRSVTSITEYYLATSANSGVTRSTSGWTTDMQVTTSINKYLWNYEKVDWNTGTTPTYVEPIIIGVHGDTGPAGTDGSDGVSAYTYIRYSEQSDGTGFVSVPTTLTKYIGIAVTTSSTAPTDKANYTWSKYQGEDGSDANIPEYIKETYIDMRSVVSPYIIGASIQGSDYVQYPEFNGSAIYAGSTATTNNFITDDDVIKPEWFAVDDVVDIGTSVWGKDLATSRTITGITDNGNGTHTYVISGAAIPLTNNASYMSKDIGYDKLFTIYDSPWADPTTPPDDSHIIGYIAYANKYSTNYRNILTLSTPNGSSNQLNLVSGNIYINGSYGILLSSGNDIQISSSSSGNLIMNTSYGEVRLYSLWGDIDIHTNTGTITIDSQDNLTIKSDKAVTIGPTSSSYKMTMSNPLLKVYNNSAYRWETYEVVTGVAVGATTTLKRIS